jgi:transcriptional regulator with XRE-family HTH domain
MTYEEMIRLFGLKVQTHRRRRGLTQEGLAEAIGKSVDTISNLERGISSTRMDTALDIANVLGVTLAELFDADGGVNDKDRERRKAVEKIVALVGDQDEATLQALGELLRVALKLRGQSGAVSP